MKKQINIFMLTLLIISQTILGPIGASVASAESFPQSTSNDVGNEENKRNSAEADTEKVEVPEQDLVKPEEPKEPVKPKPENEGSNDSEEQLDKPSVDSDEKPDENPVIKPETKPDEENKAEKPTDKEDEMDVTEGEGEDSSDQESSDEDGDEESDETADEDEEQLDEDENELLVEENINLQDNVNLNFNHLIVNGTAISNASDAANVTPTIGDKVEVYYKFIINAKQESGLGSHFTFDLPQSLLNFNQGGLNGTVSEDDVTFEFTTVGKTVTVKLIEGTLEEESFFNGTLKFFAEFNADGTNEGLEQELVIPIAGSDSITIPFVFKPKATGQSMTKSGKPVIEGNARYIEWEVWTNREGTLLEGATLNDTADGKHELDGDITVEKFAVGLSGVGSSKDTTTATSFPVSLENGRYAYKLTYKTIVTHEQENVTEKFTNTATLNNKGSEISASAEVSHTYGDKLKKTAIVKDKYKAKWQIAYNYFGSKIDSRTLVDTIKGPHKVIPGTIKVYSVTVDASGSGTIGSEVARSATIHDDGKGFDIILESPNGEAYLIEYETENESDFVINGENVENTVTDGQNTKSDSFGINENIFSKTRGAIDYDNKIITWTIKVTVENEMNNFIIEDTFTNFGEGGTRQTLLGEEGKQFNISNGSEPIITVTDKTEGFNLNFGRLSKGTNFTITYKTKFDILENGTAYGAYENKANAKWTSPVDSKEYNVEKTAGYYPGESSPTGQNGYKNGSFDYVDQVFNWNVAVNINKQAINGSVLTDTIEEGHELITDSIKVHKLILSGDDKGVPGAEVTSGFTKTVDSKQKFTIKFTEHTTDAYIITYQTKDSDNIIGNGGKAIYENKADFVTTNNNTFPLSAGVTVKHANELIKKSAEINGIEETISWTIDVNTSHSNLGHITLTDTMSKNQLILENTFQKREIKLNDTGGISHGAWETVSPIVNKENNSFTLELGNLDQKGYQVSYKTFFLGGNGDKFSNEAFINYEGEESGISKGDNITDKKFNFNDASGTISSAKGKLELHKTGYNSITGASKDLKGITFELWNNSGTIKLAEAITNDDGRLTLDDIRYGKYKLKETGTPNNYEKLPSEGLTITMNDSINFNENGGELYEVVNNEKVDVGNACEEFSLLIKDTNSDARKDVELTFISENGKTIVTRTTDANGKVSVPRKELPAGKYTVKETGDNGVYETLVISYEKNADGECKAVEIQPEIKCTAFTVTVKETADKVRTGAKVTLKKDGKDIVTVITDEKGEFTVPTTTAAGEYKLYEGKQFLGAVKIDYNDGNCGAEVIQAPTCLDFVLTIKDVDGESLDSSTTVTVKDKNTGEVIVEDAKTDNSGKLAISDLKPSEYEVHDVDGEYLGEFDVDLDCAAEIQPAPKCTDFLFTVKDENGAIRPNVEVTVKSKSGESMITKTTDEKGTIKVPSNTLPSGKYDVYEGELFIKEVTVSYKGNCEGVIAAAPVCEDFTLTVQYRSGEVRPDVEVTVKSITGETIITAKTDRNGQIKIDNKKMKQGTYQVFEKSSLINSFKVTDTCSATVKPKPLPPQPEVCTDFTIAVFEEGNPARPDIEVVLKDRDKEVAKGITNINGDVKIFKSVLPNGDYEAYVDGKKVGTVKVTDTCHETITIPTNPTCENFTLTIMENNNPIIKGKEVILKSGDKEITKGKTDVTGKVVFPINVKHGKYDVIVDGKKVGTVTVTETCEGTISYAPVCDDFTATVTKDGKPVKDKEIVLKKDDKEVAKGKTDKDGKVTFPGKMPTGDYDVYVEGEKSGKVTVGNPCEAGTIVLAPTCEYFTLTVYEDGKPVGPGKQIMLKQGETVKAVGTTNAQGKIVFDIAKLAKGEYDAYHQEVKIGKVNVTNTCEETLTLTHAPVCEEFTVTVTEDGRSVGAGKEVILKDGDKEVAKGITNTDGKVIFPGKLPNGAYDTSVDGKATGPITITNSCEAVLNVEGSSGGGNPVDPNEPGKPGEPVDPNEPGKPGEPVDPNEPGKPGEPADPNEPGKPGEPADPNEPGKPGEPVDPNEPGKPGEPVDPNEPDKPGEPADPNEPGKPGEPVDPNEPGKPSTPLTPSTPNIPAGSIGAAGSNTNGSNGTISSISGSKNPNTSTGSNLPQTGEIYPIIPITLGILLIAGGVWVLRRKKHA
ncbi:collagen binding domain-containing protein [Sporosarcina sp. P1]|uniref:collagen binding domain-containing protein n=1 Tax=Sporosarcina sp. P1 TaxID=2048257 RepID=UPI000C16848D|nr:collagen binding domain-containing protein [Sporosarcina sp. P1]PIC82297.1 hypothetical protein CSV73_12945 [Sporosarcina sp. P1]